jgi:hypothetical protein
MFANIDHAECSPSSTHIKNSFHNRLMRHFILDFSTEYHQFYILDSSTKAQTDADDFWCPEADARRLAIGEDLLGITIGSYGTVRGELRIWDKASEPYSTADHAVEASIRFPSGVLEVKNCTGYVTQLSIPLEKAAYRLRISSFYLDTVQGDVGKDFYILEMWKGRFAKPKVLKKLGS